VAARKSFLAAKNADFNDFNFKIQKFLPGELLSYKSIDTVCDATEAVNYHTAFLNSVDLPGMPSHHLQLKVRYLNILLRNLNSLRLYNDTRLIVKNLMKNVVEATIWNGKFRGVIIVFMQKINC
jgi:hypothetical protein